MSTQIHWHEGLFLQPHHLQALQRAVGARFGFERQLSRAYPYGVIEAKVSSDELENMRVRFERLVVAMPSGVIVDVPNGADLPPLDIEEAFNASTAPFVVSLGVPLFYAGRANTIELGENADWRTKKVYRVAETEQADENTGDNKQPVLVRRVNARLMLDRDDRTDMDVLPLLRIRRDASQDAGVPRVDPEYVPACMVLSGSSDLVAWAREIANRVEAARKELVNQLTMGGFNPDAMKPGGVLSVMKLSTLNRFAGRLGTIVNSARAVAPVDLYLELRDCLGELAALHPNLDPFEVPEYDHDRPGPAFAELRQKIVSHLKVEGGESFWEVPFELSNGVLVAKLGEEHFEKPNDYFLGITCGEDTRALAALVENADEFKLMDERLIRTSVYGVKLKEERHPPNALPTPTGRSYFRLLRHESGRMWERIQGEKAMALRFPGVDQGRFEKVSLFMTIPAGG